MLSIIFSILIVLVLAGPLRAGEPSSAKKKSGKTIDFNDILFELPIGAWKRIDEANQVKIQFLCSYGERRYLSLTIRPVWVPLQARWLSRKEHVSEYFNAERNSPKTHGKWEGFTEGERVVSGVAYPTMSFRITYPGTKVTKLENHSIDNLLLLYFPQDFDKREKFYVLFWQDAHPVNEQGRGLGEFDAVVSSFRVRPFNKGK